MAVGRNRLKQQVVLEELVDCGFPNWLLRLYNCLSRKSSSTESAPEPPRNVTKRLFMMMVVLLFCCKALRRAPKGSPHATRPRLVVNFGPFALLEAHFVSFITFR